MALPPKATMFLLIIVAAGLSGTTTDGTGSAGPTLQGEIFYSVNMKEMRDSFNETGQVKLPVPGDKTIIVEAEELKFREGENWSEMKPDGSVVYHKHISIAIYGRVVDGQPGEATLLLGTYGVYGRVTTTAGEYRFDPRYDEENDSFLQGVAHYVDDPPFFFSYRMYFTFPHFLT